MGSLNQVTLIGNLGADPELVDVNGTPKCKLRLATSRKYKDKQGNLQEKTQWHTVSVWGNQAQSCAQYLAKGRSVCVVGEIEYSKSEKDGVERWFTDIRAQNVTFSLWRPARRRPAGRRPAGRLEWAEQPRSAG